MNKCLILLLAFSLSLLVLPGTAMASILSLSPSTGTFNQSCDFSVDVMIDTQGIQSDGADAIIMYDTSRFSAKTITNGTAYSDFPGNNIDAATGQILITGLASVSTAFNGKGILATVNFRVLDTAAAGSTQITFDFDPNDKAKTTDSNVVQRDPVVDTLNSVVNGSYIVGKGTCGTTPKILPPTGGPATPAATPYRAPVDTLPDGGTPQLTSAMVIVGSILTVLGILGLALL